MSEALYEFWERNLESAELLQERAHKTLGQLALRDQERLPGYDWPTQGGVTELTPRVEPPEVAA